jgi:hypothetical protein
VSADPAGGCSTSADDAGPPTNPADVAGFAGDPPPETAPAGESAPPATADPVADSANATCSQAPAKPGDIGTTTTTLTQKDLGRGGSLDTGSVTPDGLGTITRELWFPRSIRAHSTKRTKARGKATTRTFLGGTVTRTINKAGVAVNLVVPLNSAARSLLRTTRTDVRVTVKTITRMRGKKASITFSAIVIKRAAGT